MKRIKQISLKDIAKKSGVSITAVSKVLNDSPIRIGSKKRKRILSVAKKLNYKPNIVARALRNKKTKTVGIIVPDMSTLFYPELIRNIETKLSAYGYRCILCNSQDNPSYEKFYVEDMVSRWIEGLIIAPAAGKENVGFLKRLYESGPPFILIDRYFPEEKFPCIISDNKEGAKKGVKFLLKEKISRIIYLGERIRNQTLIDRLEGVKETALEKNIFFTDKEIFFCEMKRGKIKEICNHLFKNIPAEKLSNTGIFLESNRFLPGLLDAARDRNLFIPDDFKIIGFDPFEPEIIYPEDFSSLFVLKKPFPVIQQDIEKIGNLTVGFLISSLEGKKQKQSFKKKVPVKIIFPKRNNIRGLINEY